MQIMQNNLNQRHVMVYSKDSETQNTIDNLGFSGKVLDTQHDYLSIINSNLGGTKTDLDIEQSVNLKSKILSDGSIINTLTINRTNTSEVKNRNFLRVLVPFGSELISTKGFDETKVLNSEAEGLSTDPDLGQWDKGVESGKTRFGGFIETMGGKESIVTLTYMLPFRISTSHSLLIQKQAGSLPINFVATISLGGYKVEWVTSDVHRTLNSLEFTSNTNLDDFWGFVLTK
jgi:hypothetical protein